MHAIKHDEIIQDLFSRLATDTRSGHTYLDRYGQETRLSYAQLYRNASRLAASMWASDLTWGDRVGIALSEPRDFIAAFVACMIARVIPIPLAPPILNQNLDAYAAGVGKILNAAQAGTVITTRPLAISLQPAFAASEAKHRLLPIEWLEARDAGSLEPIPPAADDCCYIQFTSGSTGTPKGAIITYRNLKANLWAIMRHGLDIRYTDVSVSWLPMYHDMGLVGKMLAPLAFSVEMIYLPTLEFVKKPSTWISALSRYKATISFAPNFAYMLAAKRPPADTSDTDLSHVRVLGCGAEPINPAVIRTFLDTFTRFGLNPNALMPCYGLAEATLAVAFDSLSRPPTILAIDRATAQSRRRVVPAAGGEPAIEVVSCGTPLPGHEVSIRDKRGVPLADGHIGEIWLKGANISSGYIGNPEETSAAIRNGWLKTGDLGSMVGGELFITGRSKDLIIINGRNLAPSEFEWAVEPIPEIRDGHVAAFGVPAGDTEGVVIVTETNGDAETDTLANQIRACVHAALSVAVHDIVLVRRGTLPKTTSGKIRRAQTRRAYLDGKLQPIGRTGGQHSSPAGRIGDLAAL